MRTLGPGERVERYVIEAPLGEGGMGRVYRALDERLDRRVALKVLLGGGDDDTEGRARMLREARAAAALDHPNVVHVYDVGEADGSPFIAMELVSGRSIRSLIGDASVPMTERVSILAGVASGLAAAHDANLVHRDVKPENVIVRADGRVKVLDFGIARRNRQAVDPSAPTSASLATLTAEGVKVGTPMYMAPEQIRGDAVDGRTDQFAWGVTAYELCAGRPPFVANDSMALMAAILTDEPAPLGPEVPEGVARVILRALRKKPAERFASMHEIVDALTSSAEGATPRAPTKRPPREEWPRPPSAPPPAWTAARAQPAPTLSRRYSPKELEEILDRALALQPVADTTTGYRYEEIASAAREVGVDEPTLAAAMRDMVKRGAVEAPASDQLRRKNRFYRHAGIQAAFAAFFFLLNFSDNVFGNGREWWFEFPVVSFGVLLAIHAAFYFFPTPKAAQPLSRRSPDPRIEHDARALSHLIATRVPRVRVAPIAPAPVARAAAERRDQEAEIEADLALDDDPRRQRNER